MPTNIEVQIEWLEYEVKEHLYNLRQIRERFARRELQRKPFINTWPDMVRATRRKYDMVRRAKIVRRRYDQCVQELAKLQAIKTAAADAFAGLL